MLLIGKASSSTMDVVRLDIANTCNVLEEKSMHNVITMEPLSLNGFIEFQSMFDCFEIKMIYDGGEILNKLKKLILDLIDVVIP